MSGLELAGLVLGLLGPVEQTINITNILRNHCKAFGENETVTQQLCTFLNHLQHDLKQLHSQLQHNQSSIPQSNHKVIETQLMQMKNKFEEIHPSLSKMSQSAGRNLKHFFKASKWSDNCQAILTNLRETQHSLRDINLCLGGIEATKHNIDTARIEIVKAVQTHGASSSTDHTIETFQPYFQKLPISIAAKLDFKSLDSNGEPCTIEGKLKQRLIKTTVSNTKLFSIFGPGGVGKTTTMHMLTHNRELQEFFSDGIYYLKLGANAKVESVINNLADITRKSGGTSTASKVQRCQTFDNAIEVLSAWFQNKKYLLLVDDVWQHGNVGSSCLLSLKRMTFANDVGGMIFTTRDPTIASESLQAFRLDYRDPQGQESRSIMFRHARQDHMSEYGQATEQTIEKLLTSCGGLPVAHSVVGKGVFEYSMRRNVGEEKAWRLYARRQDCILERKGDEYESLHIVFKASIGVLEEALENKKRKRDQSTYESKYCYEEIFRSLSVLQKQQWIPVEILGCMWNIESEDEIREICGNLVRVGLAEWHYEEETEDEDMDADVEGISIHDLLHDFAEEEAKRNDEKEVWHRRIIDGYWNRHDAGKRNADECRQWWEIGESNEEKDGGYLMRNICRHLFLGECGRNEIVKLVTKPEWIRFQLNRNGLLQYESDLKYGCEWTSRTGDDGEMGLKELEMIRDAVRLSASYILKNGDEVWFQLYGRLMRYSNKSAGIKKYLEDIEKNAPRPWLKPMYRSDRLLTSVGHGRRVVDVVGYDTNCMVLLPGDEEVVCGCVNGELVIVSLKESVVKRSWMGHDSWINDMELVERGRYVVSVASDGLGKIWEAGKWCLVRTLKGHSGKINVVKVSRDEKHLYTAGDDETIRIWDFGSGRCLRIFRTGSHLLRFREVVELNDRDCIVTEKDGTIEVWKVENQIDGEGVMGQECKVEELNEDCKLKEIKGYETTSCSALNEDGSRMIIGNCDGSVQLWDVKSMNPIGDAWSTDDSIVLCVAFSNDGTKIVSGCGYGTIQVRDVNTGDLVCLPFVGHSFHVNNVHFTAQDDKIVSNSHERTVRVWKINDSPEVLNEEPNDVWCVTCSPDQSNFITGHGDGRLRIWNAATGQLIRKSSVIHDQWICDVEITADNRWIISAGSDKTVRVSDWKNLEVLYTFEGHNMAANRVKIAESQEFFVTSYDKMIRIWDLKKCDGSHEVLESSGWEEFFQFYISDDEKRIIVVGGIEGFVEVWSIESKRLVRKCHDSLVWGMLREERMKLAGEAEVEGTYTAKKIFVRPGGNEIQYGNCLHSVVLGTCESFIYKYAYSTKHQTVAVVPSGDERLVTLQLQV